MGKHNVYGSILPERSSLLWLGAIDGEQAMYPYSNRSRHLSGKNDCLSPLSNPGGLFKIRKEHFYVSFSRDDEEDNGEVKVDGKIIRKREIDRFEKGK